MTTAAELRQLAEEVEKLEGPSRQMDQRIELAILGDGWEVFGYGSVRRKSDGGARFAPCHTRNELRASRVARALRARAALIEARPDTAAHTPVLERG